MQVIIDETVILRYLLDDDKKLSNMAKKLIATGNTITYPEITARVAVSLRDVYGVPRSLIASSLDLLLNDVYVTEEDIVRYAARLFGSSNMDFVDCLLVARNALHGYEVRSFNKPIMRKFM